MAAPFKVIKAKTGGRWIQVGALWKDDDKIQLSLNSHINLTAFARVKEDDRGNQILSDTVYFQVFDYEEKPRNEQYSNSGHQIGD